MEGVLVVGRGARTPIELYVPSSKVQVEACNELATHSAFPPGLPEAERDSHLVIVEMC